ncbi:MAG TPA: hypothetical protein VFV51_13645 [Vicinamibacterales bacterium]|nr:hypothetical protein [Vicinamibacterales bacterium]
MQLELDRQRIRFTAPFARNPTLFRRRFSRGQYWQCNHHYSKTGTVLMMLGRRPAVTTMPAG